MPQAQTQYSVAENLCRLARDFKSGDPVQAAAIRKDFKRQSKNDIERAVVYLMEVIGSRDAQFQEFQREHKALKELLDLKAPGWDKEETPAPVADQKQPGEVNGATQTN